MNDMQVEKVIAKVKESECKPLLTAPLRNPKITLDLLQPIASTFRSAKKIAVLDYLLENIDSDSVLTIHIKSLQDKLGLTNTTLYSLMRHMRYNSIVKYIDPVNPPKGYEGHQKMMVNPTMAYNRKKPNPDTQYQEDAQLLESIRYWEYLYTSKYKRRTILKADKVALGKFDNKLRGRRGVNIPNTNIPVFDDKED